MIAFLREENRVLKVRLGGQRLRLEDHERRRLAELGHRLGRRVIPGSWLRLPCGHFRRECLELVVERTRGGQELRIWFDDHQ